MNKINYLMYLCLFVDGRTLSKNEILKILLLNENVLYVSYTNNPEIELCELVAPCHINSLSLHKLFDVVKYKVYYLFFL